MASNISRRVQTVDKEILIFPAGLDAIDSVVLSASGVQALPSATTGVAGQYGLLAGTILTKIPGDTLKRYREYTGAGGEAIEGILGDNIYFYTNTEDTEADEPADMLFFGCVFNKDKIKDYSTHAAALATALPTCDFREQVTGP